MLCEFPRSVKCDQALRVDEVDAALGLFLGHPLEREETHHLLRDADTGRTRSQEEDTVVSEGSPRRLARQFGRIEEAREHDLCSKTVRGCIQQRNKKTLQHQYPGYHH